MPESEPKPRLIELVGPGAAQGWKAVLKNGKAVVVHEIPVPPAEAAAAAPRLQRLFEHRHPALSPVLGWGTDTNGVWVAVEPNEGTPLGTILSRGPFTPPAAAALGAAVLSGVAALHETGIAMGGFNASAVRVTGNGDVRLAGHPAAAVRGAPSQSDLRADVRSCGMAVCAAFGVDPAGAPAPPNIPPGLVVTMRSMASGAMGPAADRAMGALREMASALLAPDRQVAAQSELALRSGGREVPPVTPFLPHTEQPAPAPVPTSPAPAAPAAPSTLAPPGPAQWVPPAPREETPIRAPASYEAPDRPVQTYSGLPAIPGPAAAAPPPATLTPPAPAEPRPIPTWSEAPPRTPAYETAPPAAATNPPASTAPPAEPAGDAFPSAPAPAPATSEPSGSRSAFDSVVPAPAASGAPAAAAPAPSPAAPAKQTWTPVEQPVWQPGEVAIPGLGTTAAAAAAATATADPPAAVTNPPAPSAPTAPVRTPPAARRPAISLPSERPPWLVPAAVAVVILILLVIGGGVLASHLHGSPSGSGNPATSPSAKTSAHASASPTSVALHEIPTLAPATAGQVQSVQFCTAATPCPFTGDKDTNCTIDGPCTVDVGVIFTTTYTGTYSYDIMYFDRCTGTAPVTLLSHQDTSKAFKIGEPATVLTVQLPPGGKAAALFVVTRTPAGAQSAPLKLGAESCG